MRPVADDQYSSMTSDGRGLGLTSDIVFEYTGISFNLFYLNALTFQPPMAIPDKLGLRQGIS